MSVETIQDVIEAHRKEIGAISVHATLGLGATAEGLRTAFDAVNREAAIYGAFTELERERALVARLKGQFGKIRTLTHVADGSPDEIRGALRSIFSLSDMICDADLFEDTRWMVTQRLARGEELPPEAIDLLDARPA